MPARRINDEVYVSDEPIVQVTRGDVEWLKSLSAGTRRHRVRLCAHQSAQDTLHEMLIVLDGATYVRPHRHRNKSESFHVVEGVLTVVIFGETGQVREVIRLGEYTTGRPFYYRLSEPAYHTVLIESVSAVIHETTNGPFDRAETEFAPWSPPEEEEEAGRRYARELARAVGIEVLFPREDS